MDAGSSAADARAIRLEDFVAARSREISSLRAHLSHRYGTQRVFQSVPRHLRRRAASHNIKRLPVRFRAAADAERDRDLANGSQPKDGGRASRRKRRRPGLIRDEYMRRQAQNNWLETHIWHAKRMKMASLWGWKLPMHPTDKSYRFGARAARSTCLLHDASYLSVIELSGPQDALCRTVRPLSDPLEPSMASARFLSGARSGTARIHRSAAEIPHSFIAPVSFLWRQQQQKTGDAAVWVWVHPLAAADVHAAFAASAAAHASHETVSVRTLERELLRFDLAGPRSHALLASMLTVCDEATTAEARDAWKALAPLTSTGSLPQGAAIALTVMDPRIEFPKKMPPRPTEQMDTKSAEALGAVLRTWPSTLAVSSLWDRPSRSSVSSSRCPEKDINARRAAARVSLSPPATPYTPSDARIPIIIVRLSDTGVGSGDGWSVILPSGWGVDFWKLLVFGGARVGGQRESRSLALFGGAASFPHDYPLCAAFNATAELDAAAAEATHLRRPPAKRVAFAKLRVAAAFRAPFDSLGGSATWVARGRAAVAAVSDSCAGETEWANEVKAKWPAANPDAALVTARVEMAARGVPAERAAIYAGGPALIAEWGARQRRAARTAAPFEHIGLDDALAPSEDDVIGYVTSGGYAPTAGAGTAIATVAVARLVSHMRACQSEKAEPLVWVRNVTSPVFYPARLVLIEA